jgi:hypothetical protein
MAFITLIGIIVLQTLINSMLFLFHFGYIVFSFSFTIFIFKNELMTINT